MENKLHIITSCPKYFGFGGFMRQIITILIIFCLCPNIYAKTIEKGSIELFKSKLNYELTLPDDWNDPGEFDEVNLTYKDSNLTLDKMCYVSPFNECNLSDFIDKINSKIVNETQYFIVLKNPKTYLLIFFEYAFASDPNVVSVFTVTNKSIHPSFKGHFDFIDILDLNDDGNLDFLGREALPQPEGGDDKAAYYTTYVPFSIYIYSDNTKSFIYNENLSEKYNKKNYVWAGKKMSEKIRVKIINGKYFIEEK